jgi:hypothetical protein
MRWFKREGASSEILVWSCVPLVIVDPNEGMVYAMNTQVEFQPDPENPQAGIAIAVTPAESGWIPSLRVSQRFDDPVAPYPGERTRGGSTLFGEDEEGFSFTWYINAAADRVILHDPEATPRSRVMSDARRQRILSMPLKDEDAERLHASPLVIIEEDGGCPHSGPAEVAYQALEGSDAIAHCTVIGAGLELFVLDEHDVDGEPSGHVLNGIDRMGRWAAWYLDGAALKMTESL